MSKTQITITEALQEIKTIGKRLEKKRASVIEYLVRDSRIRDPLEKDGGSEQFVARERQAIADLEKRIIAIRTAIQEANLTSYVAVEGQSHTVAEWLTWRREISAGSKTFLMGLGNSIRNLRTKIQQQGGRVVAAAVAINEPGGPDKPPEVIVNIDEAALLKEQETMEQILGDLDGKLSLFNATKIIEI